MSFLEKIILTLDYEIFFGHNSGTIERCLLIPTEFLSEEIFKNFPIEKIIFVDFLFLWNLKANGLNTEYEKIKKQINLLVEKLNCKVGLHVHSHWLDADYDFKTRKWKFKNYERYIFSSLDKKDICDVLDKCKFIAENLLPGYKIEWFRAGGWCIEPFEKIAPFLKKFGIKKDSSVVQGMVIKSIAHNIDFRKAPLKPYWRFNQSTLVEDPNGYFEEYPITSAFLYPICQRIRRISLVNNASKEIWGDGTPIPIQDTSYSIVSRLFEKVKKLFLKQVYMLNFEWMSAGLMKEVVKRYLETVPFNMEDPKHKIIFIGHPKGISPWSVLELKRFLEEVQNGKIT